MKVLIMGLLLFGVALADVVTDWNSIMRTTLRGQTPQAQARLAAITHLAVFEAVNAITKEYEPYLGTITAAPGASPDAAAVAAAWRVLRNYFPASAPTLDIERDRFLAMIPNGSSKSEGVSVGEAAAAAMIAERANDGAATPMVYTPPIGVGYWQPAPPALAAATFLHWGKVKPFGMLSGDQFRSKPPPGFNTGKYRRDFNEVKEVGSASSTGWPQGRLDVVRYIAMISPTLVSNDVAVQLSTAEELSLSENARMFALLNMAIADASIAVFESKYFYNFWRPVTAIRNADLDGNPRTTPDPNFLTFLNTPPYPSYPSGAGGLNNAGTYVLERYFGSGGHSITLSDPVLSGITLKYTRMRQLTDDIADARVYAGIHFRFEQEAAELLGRRVARYVYNNNLQCTQAEACEDSVDDE